MMNTQFYKDVDQGLSNPNKTIPSKYFYDKKGDELFMQIMALPEYYLTRAELEIFSKQAEDLIASFDLKKGEYFELIELGAGDGSKTYHLLKALLESGHDFDYMPIDISQNVLNLLEARLTKELSHLSIKPMCGDYFEMLGTLGKGKHKKIVLFLGSNIGNMSDDRATNFLYRLGANLAESDKLLLGVDLIKSKDLVLPAYNDAQGVTRDFNLNLLHRINTELSANFEIDKFQHVAEYCEEEGVARSYIKSNIKQEVGVGLSGKKYQFSADERIHVETSRKYNEDVLHRILQDTDFSMAHIFSDSRGLFADVVLNRDKSSQMKLPTEHLGQIIG